MMRVLNEVYCVVGSAYLRNVEQDRKELVYGRDVLLAKVSIANVGNTETYTSSHQMCCLDLVLTRAHF
jgi:hypothetical protein